MFRGQAAQRDEAGPAPVAAAPEECRRAVPPSDESAPRPAIGGTAFVAIFNHGAAARIGGCSSVVPPEICMSSSPELSDGREGPEARREFLKKCGRFAVVTPPAMTLLLSVSSLPREAYASTIGHQTPSWPPFPKPPFWPPGFPWPF